MNFSVILFSYLLGSVNFAYITARIKGIDISSSGSGNPGTSNVLRTLGKSSAAIVLLGDLLKGAIPIIFFSNDTVKGSLLKFWNLKNSFRFDRLFNKIK